MCHFYSALILCYLIVNENMSVTQPNRRQKKNRRAVLGVKPINFLTYQEHCTKVSLAYRYPDSNELNKGTIVASIVARLLQEHLPYIVSGSMNKMDFYFYNQICYMAQTHDWEITWVGIT